MPLPFTRVDGKGVKKDPLISVIVPAYSAATFIRETLDSVFGQTFGDFEVVLINDGSPDTTEFETEIADFLSRIVYLKQENRGISGARNTAIGQSRGHYLAFLDSDDIWEPDYLSTQITALRSNPGADLVYPNAEIFGVGPHVGRSYMEVCPSEGAVTFESLITQRCNVMVSILARREAVIRAGLFDETLNCSEDFDLWLRMVKSGSRLIYHRKNLVRYRRRPNSLSSDAHVIYENMLRVMKKCADQMALTDDERKVIDAQSRRTTAMKNLLEGKRAIRDGDFGAAIGKFGMANEFLHTWKLRMTLWCLRYAPVPFRAAYNLRERRETWG